jgi:hypothetical protein
MDAPFGPILAAALFRHATSHPWIASARLFFPFFCTLYRAPASFLFPYLHPVPPTRVFSFPFSAPCTGHARALGRSPHRGRCSRGLNAFGETRSKPMGEPACLQHACLSRSSRSLYSCPMEHGGARCAASHALPALSLVFPGPWACADRPFVGWLSGNSVDSVAASECTSQPAA